MWIEHFGKQPQIHEFAYVAPTAVICGDVTIGENSRILYRLAFRELGLSIGLHAVERLWAMIEDDAASWGRRPERDSRIQALRTYVPLADQIEAFWLEPAHQATGSWAAHRDINAVMLATSLLPESYLRIG